MADGPTQKGVIFKFIPVLKFCDVTTSVHVENESWPIMMIAPGAKNLVDFDFAIISRWISLAPFESETEAQGIGLGDGQYCNGVTS